MKRKLAIYNHRVSDSLQNNHILEDENMKNQRSIVNHDILDCSANDALDKVLGVHHYSGRVLGSTNPEDVLQLNPDLKEHWDWISGHYKKAGISYSETIIWNDSFDVMTGFNHHEPSVFFFGDRAHKAKPDQAWYDIVKKMNSKNDFIEICSQLNVPTPKTWCFDCKSQVDVEIGFPFPVYLKIAVSVSGLGVVKCNNASELEIELLKIERNIPLQIQEGKDAFTFLNLQYRKNGKLERVLATEQVLKGCCHVGNAYPTKHQPWELTDGIAEEMVHQGMRGYFAFDIAACNENGKVAYYAIECNPRFNGSSYPTNIAKKIGAKNWIAKKVSTSMNSFSNVDLGEIQYTPKKGVGVIVVNWGSITEKEIGVMFVSDNAKQEQMFEEKLLNCLQ